MAPCRRGGGNSATGTISIRDTSNKWCSGLASSLFLVRHIADDVGDVLVPLLLLLDEGGIINGLIDLNVLGALDDFAFAVLLSLRLGIRILERHEFGVRGLRYDRFFLGRSLSAGSNRFGSRPGGSCGKRQDCRALRADSRVLAEIVKFCAAIAA